MLYFYFILFGFIVVTFTFIYYSIVTYVKAQLEFELAYYNVVVQHVNHNTTGTFVPYPQLTLCEMDI